VGNIQVKVPPYFWLPADGVVEAGIELTGVELNGVVVEGWTTGVVEPGGVDEVVIDVEVLLPQPVTMKAISRRITQGIRTFFIISSFTIDYLVT
jgi:hypothetical protein